jgi:hypothetical protein
VQLCRGARHRPGQFGKLNASQPCAASPARRPCPGYQNASPSSPHLGIEAYKTAKTREARNVLLERLQNAISLIAGQAIYPSERMTFAKLFSALMASTWPGAPSTVGLCLEHS